MPMPLSQLGVQSYCFRAFKENARVAELVRDLGLSVIELCGVHADFDDQSKHEQVIATYRDAGITLPCLGVQTFTDQPDTERNWFEFARQAGCSVMSANFLPDTHEAAMKSAAGLADEYGIRLAIHNHGGYHWLGSSQMLKHIFSITGPQIGLCLDTAWCLQAGEDPVAWVETFGDRLYGLHYKDFTFDHAGKHEDVPIGDGGLDLPALLEKIDQVNFSGVAVLESEGDVNDPVPALKTCVENILAAGVMR